MLEDYRFSAGKFSVTFEVFELTGSDVHLFLQNQSTYNFSHLNVDEFHLTSFLDPQGRLEFYCWVLKSHSSVSLLVPTSLASQALIRLEKFLISEDVTITPRGSEDWNLVLGPKSKTFKQNAFYSGIMFEEEAIFTKDSPQCSQITPIEQEAWRCLNGWPTFDGLDFKVELINNLRLYDLSVSQNKGCYPGQETVSKIATRRGAAYAPVLLETSTEQSKGPLYSFEKKIGEIENCHSFNGRFYLSCSLLRDFRVAGMKMNFSKDGVEFDSVVRYYPLLPGDAVEKSLELFYEATESFQVNDLQSAEKKFRLSIELNPEFADAYEALGVMLGRLERFSEAIELMDRLTSIDPKSVLAHTNKSLFLMRMGNIEEAEKEKSLATVKSFQKFGEEAKVKEALEAEKKHQESEWAKRESMFRQVLEIDEEDTLANYGLGSIAVEKKNWSLAIDHLVKVIAADANYSVAYLALGKAYKGSGDKVKARDIWLEGIKIAAKKGDLMPANQMQSEVQNLN